MDWVGLFGLFFTMVVQVIVPPIPAEVIVIGAARVYGVSITTGVAGLGLFCGSALVYLFGRYLKHRFSRFFDKEKVRIIVSHFRRHADFILWLRILPYNPSDSISYVAGLIGVPARKYLGVTAVAASVRCLTLSLMGSAITSWDRLLQIASALVLSALAVHLILFARRRPKSVG